MQLQLRLVAQCKCLPLILCGVVQYLAEIEEHLGVTIDQVDTSLQVAANEFDGKVTYGQKRSNTGTIHMAIVR